MPSTITDSTITNSTLDDVTLLSPLDAGGERISNLGVAQDVTDAASVLDVYMTALGVAGIQIREDVAAATTGENIDLATGGLLIVDDYQTLEGDRIMVKDQTALAENGYYYASVGPWLRTPDMQNGSDFVLASAKVVNGTVNANTYFSCAVYNPIIVGADPVPIVPFNFDLYKLHPGNLITFGPTGAGQTIDFSGTLDQIDPPTADVSFGGFKITDLAAPVDPTDGVNKAYVDSTGGGDAYLANNQTFSGANTFSQPIAGEITGNAATSSAWDHTVTMTAAGDVPFVAQFSGAGSPTFLAQPTLATVNPNVGTFTKATYDGKGRATSASQASLTDLSPPTADFSMGSHKITSLANPVNPGDAVNYSQFTTDLTNNLNTLAYSRLYNENAFGINGGVFVIEFLEITQTVNDNCFSIELHVMSYQNDTNPTTPNTYSATYQIDAMRNQTAGAWQILYPTSASHSKNDAVNLYPQIEIKVTGLVMNIRERRKNFSANPGFMDIGYRSLTKNGQGAQVSEFINENSDPEPTVIYRNNMTNGYLSDNVDTTITSAIAGNTLTYSGTKWVNDFVAPMLSAYFFSPRTFTSGVGMTLVLDGVLWDTAGNYDTSTGIFTATVPGFYQVSLCSTATSTVAIEWYIVSIYQNSGLQAQGSFANNNPASTSTQIGSVVTKTLRLEIDDTVNVYGVATGSGTLSLNFSAFTISFLSS